ncbi:unnamed protein product [Cuscuta europaea]|uniref:Uncharacterized protein n=1 Tax=Cuscuta europaea TaxID=41803 RepID=A0A9P0YUV2_CUSEU|nr:unnamed protein product [Cuscuta europaea]
MMAPCHHACLLQDVFGWGSYVFCTISSGLAHIYIWFLHMTRNLFVAPTLISKIQMVLIIWLFRMGECFNLLYSVRYFCFRMFFGWGSYVFCTISSGLAHIYNMALLASVS